MMNKKNGVNIMLFVFIINLIMLLSCIKNSKREAQGIFLFYAADSGVVAPGVSGTAGICV
jgi:hypothetical protein